MILSDQLQFTVAILWNRFTKHLPESSEKKLQNVTSSPPTATPSLLNKFALHMELPMRAFHLSVNWGNMTGSPFCYITQGTSDSPGKALKNTLLPREGEKSTGSSRMFLSNKLLHCRHSAVILEKYEHHRGENWVSPQPSREPLHSLLHTACPQHYTELLQIKGFASLQVLWRVLI